MLLFLVICPKLEQQSIG